MPENFISPHRFLKPVRTDKIATKIGDPSFSKRLKFIMKINILLFGQLTEITGADTVTLESIVDTDSLVSTLHASYSALANAKYVIAVDKKLITENTLLSDNCTVALLPPFSGG